MGRQLKAIEAFEAQAVKNAEETKGLVDKELGDLAKTLKNIEEARPFEDLTVVCGVPSENECGFLKRKEADRSCCCCCCRMRLLPLGQTLMSALRSSSRRDAGKFLVTRYFITGENTFGHVC